MYSYVHTPSFNDCVTAGFKDMRRTADLMHTLAELASQPFGNPRLQSHRMHNAEGKTYISYVGGPKGHRLIWRLIGKRTIALLLFGEHDPIEQRAERLRLDIDLDEERVVVLDEDPATRERVPYTQLRQRVGTLFMAWNDAQLAGFGFAPHEVDVLRGLDTETALAELEPRMRPAAFTTAYNLVAHGHPDGEQPVEVAAERPEEFVLEQEADEAREDALERAVARPASRPEFAPVEADALAEVLSKPIEDWMVFLHPDQVRLTERPFAGPARVRGAAGTGKTVVALHRARHLADTYDGTVLFTTYVRNLPPVYAQLYRRLSPTTADRVEFVNLHKWAWRFCARCGASPPTDPKAADAAFTRAWRDAARPDSLLKTRGFPAGYYREEIDWVVKGRGLDSLDAYLALARTGRGSPLPAPHRRAVWDLYTGYQRELDRHGCWDFNDVLLEALRLVEAGHLPEPYAAVIVDEAQDLTEVGVRLAHALGGGDKRDGLLLVGDGQQAVYPGGYSLASVGIDVVGRSAVLRTNYRNTRQILGAARRVIGERPFDDLDEELTDGRRDVVCLREGPEPVFAGFGDVDDHDTALVAAIDDAARSPGVGSGDLAVLVATNKLVDTYAGRIRDLGYRTVPLERYDGTPGQEVKVGTYQRGKGLEFKQVFLPRLEPATLGDTQRFNEDAETHAERVELLRRRLFVSMTRARDELWCGWVGAPSRLLGVGVGVGVGVGAGDG